MSGMLRQPSQSSTIVEHRRHRDLAHAGDEDAHGLVHLRRRQPDARVFVHRLEHVVDELLDDRRSDRLRRHRLRLGPQDWMPHAGDLQDGHAVII